MKVVIEREVLNNLCWAMDRLYGDEDFVHSDEVKKCFDEFEAILKDVFYAGQESIKRGESHLNWFEDAVEVTYIKKHENIEKIEQDKNLAQTIKMIDDFRRMDK